MNRIATRWGACAWIAILAILFNALAPIVSHARAGSPGASAPAAQVEVCTALGMAMVSMPEQERAQERAQERDPGHVMQGMNHCAYCATHAGSFGLLPPGGVLAVLVGGHDAYPALFFQSPYPLPVWLAAQARGPPAAA